VVWQERAVRQRLRVQKANLPFSTKAVVEAAVEVEALGTVAVLRRRALTVGTTVVEAVAAALQAMANCQGKVVMVLRASPSS
jgi:hypothetical protein